MTKLRQRTLPNEKLVAAHAWCVANRSSLPKHCQWLSMKRETLYAFLESMNVRWSPARKQWRKTALMTFETPHIDKNFSAGVVLSTRVSVRITAPSSSMDQVIAEFTELCEALDWHVRVSPKKYPNGNDGFERVYIEVDRTRV